MVTDTTADGGRPHLWLLDRNGKPPRQLTFSTSEKDKGQYQASWLPDASAVLFLEDAGSGPRLCRMPVYGGEAQQLTLRANKEGSPEGAWKLQDAGSEFDIRDYAVSPDGRLVALMAVSRDSAEEQARKVKGDDATRFGDDIHEATLQILDLSNNRALGIAVAGVQSLAWDQTSQRILAVTHTKFANLGPSASIWIVDPRNASGVRRIENLPTTVAKAQWVTENEIVYLAQCQQDTPPYCWDLYDLDLRTRVVKNLTDRVEGTVASTSPDASDTPLIVAAAKHGKKYSAVLLFDRGVSQSAAVVPLDGGPVEFVDGGLPVVSSIETNEHQTSWVLIAGDSTHPSVPLLLSAIPPARTPAALRVTRLGTPDIIPPGRTLVASTHVSWHSDDAKSISGLLYLPPASAPRPLPLVVNVHGGPAGQFTDRYYAIVNLLVAQGWAVLQPNPRGSTGYSKAFLAANKDDLGGGDLQDILAGVDYVTNHFGIDSHRLALIGYSYGGEMAGFAAGKTGIFRAVISGGPVTDQLSEYGTEDGEWAWYDHWYFGNPTTRFSAAWRQSPIGFAPKATTPVLIVQGLADTEDPPGQAFELYRALSEAGDKVELVTFPRESHSQLHRNFYGEVSVEPWHGLDLRNRMLEFLSREFAAAQQK
ncbi:MAG: S9 family peptidase [Gammaproteobacteria bacterium]|nr:S9 family peptidase [Gammaproteobacteria bacterium]